MQVAIGVGIHLSVNERQRLTNFSTEIETCFHITCTGMYTCITLEYYTRKLLPSWFLADV